jgi:hypothetical protein
MVGQFARPPQLESSLTMFGTNLLSLLLLALTMGWA